MDVGIKVIGRDGKELELLGDCYSDLKRDTLWVAGNEFGECGMVICARDYFEAWAEMVDNMPAVPMDELWEAYGFNSEVEYTRVVEEADATGVWPTLELCEGFEHMPNSGGTTGIVQTGHYQWIRRWEGLQLGLNTWEDADLHVLIEIESINEGTVIQGTMRPRDVVPALVDELARLDKRESDKILHEYLDDAKRYKAEFYEQEVAIEMMIELIDKLADLAPAGMYFGAHVADGSDLGWWEYEDDDTSDSDSDNESEGAE